MSLSRTWPRSRTLLLRWVQGDLSANPPIQNPWLKRIAFALFFVVVGVILSFGAFLVWLGTYPDNVDPRNIYYVLWKHGLSNNMNLDDALVALQRLLTVGQYELHL